MTLTEVLVIVLMLFIMAVLFLNNSKERRIQQQARLSNCLQNLKQTGLAYRIWADDHQGQFPMEVSVAGGGTRELVATGNINSTFQVMSNELLDPRILHCPCDTNHSIFHIPPGPVFLNSIATNFSGDLKNHVSYFIGLDASTNHPNVLLSGDDNFEIGGVDVKSGVLKIISNAPISWSAARHHLIGNIVLADGSVQILTQDGFRQSIQKSGATNRLAIP